MKRYTTKATISGETTEAIMEVVGTRARYFDEHGRDLGRMADAAAASGDTKLYHEVCDAIDALNSQDEDDRERNERGGVYYRGPAPENDFDYSMEA